MAAMDWQRLRVEGVYQQNDQGQAMLRIKVPAGVLSAAQARRVAQLAERFTSGPVHLTTRGSIELHGVEPQNLAAAQRLLAGVGLTTRGACGGAVRGVSCSTAFSENFALVHVLVRKLHAHFAGNPHFEGLAKKFKIGVEGGYSAARHLIQDVGLVYVGSDERGSLYDLWLAGGLGREPLPAFRYAERLPEARIIPVIEAVLRVYRSQAPKGKRLKFVRRDIGEQALCRLIDKERAGGPQELDLSDALDKFLTARPGCEPVVVEAGVFAGELTVASLRDFADLAERYSDGYLVLTTDQNVAFLLADPATKDEAAAALAACGFSGDSAEQSTRFRICPGNHECRMGLCATRDAAKAVLAALDEEKKSLSWAIAGCPNSCAQPQLADYGIVTVKSVRGEDGTRSPRFDLYRREGEGFGERIAEAMALDDLLEEIR